MDASAPDTLESSRLLSRGPLTRGPSRGGHQPGGAVRHEPGPECLGGRETEAWGGRDLTGGVPTCPRQGRLARCVCRGNPGTPRASSSGPRSAILPTPKRVLSESPQHTTHHLVSAQKMPVKDTCQRGKQRTGEKPAPVSRGEGSPAEAEPAASPRLTAAWRAPGAGVGHVGTAGVEAPSVAQQV